MPTESNCFNHGFHGLTRMGSFFLPPSVKSVSSVVVPVTRCFVARYTSFVARWQIAQASTAIGAVALVVSCMAASATDCAAGPNLVANGGFEDPAISDGGYQGSEYGIWYTDEIYLIKDAQYRLSGWFRTEGDSSGLITLAPAGTISFGATPEWTYVERVFDATATSREVLTVQGYGAGQVYCDDFCTSVYGPAAAPVKQYFQALEQLVTGAASAHVPHNHVLLTLATCSELETYLAAAEAAAGSDVILLGRMARLRIAVYYTRILLSDPNAEAVKSAANALILAYDIQIQNGKYVF